MLEAGRAEIAAAGFALDYLEARHAVTLAPVADLPSVDGSALAGRAFSSDPDAATAAVAVGGVTAAPVLVDGLGKTEFGVWALVGSLVIDDPREAEKLKNMFEAGLAPGLSIRAEGVTEERTDGSGKYLLVTSFTMSFSSSAARTTGRRSPLRSS